MTFARLVVADRANASAVGAALLTLPLAIDLPTAIKLGSLALSFGAIALAGPVSALMVVCLALPFSSCVFVIGTSEWSPLELALLSCAAAVGLGALREVLDSRSLSPLWRMVWPFDLVLLAGAILILSVASIAWVADTDLRPDSVRSLRRVIIEPLFVIPALADIRRRGMERILVPWLALPALAVSILAIVQTISGLSTVDIGGIERPIGTFTHPNNLAFYLERAIWFTPLLALPLIHRHGRLAWLIPIAVAIATLATVSRGAAVALGVGAVVLFWEDVRRRWRLPAGVALAGAFLVFVSRYFAETGDSVDTRTTIWRAAIDMIQDRPVTGVGLDQFLGQYGRRYVRPEGWPERYTSHPHNLVLDFWLSLGIGGLAVLWLLIELVGRRLKAALEGPALSVQRASVAMLAAGLAHGVIDNSVFLPYLATFTWLGLGLSSPTQGARNG